MAAYLAMSIKENNFYVINPDSRIKKNLRTIWSYNFFVSSIEDMNLPFDRDIIPNKNIKERESNLE